jgi:hypothetical protein
MSRIWVAALAVTIALAGCDDGVSPRDLTPPAAPRGLRSVTGDHTAYLSWLENTEPDVTEYRVYESSCARGPSCPFTFVASTSTTQLTVSGLTNGQTRYFAVAAVDRAGNESELSDADVFDTPRPEGFGSVLNNFLTTPAGSGWDFSANTTRAYDNPATDMFFGDNGSVSQMFVPDLATEIQDAGYATTLDAVDYAPSAGWSPTGSVELIVGHCYVVLTRTGNYAKFRVTAVGASQVEFDWAYQVDTGNPELVRYPAPDGQADARPARRGVVWSR